jgi:hypothetical protein
MIQPDIHIEDGNDTNPRMLLVAIISTVCVTYNIQLVYCSATMYVGHARVHILIIAIPD